MMEASMWTLLCYLCLANHDAFGFLCFRNATWMERENELFVVNECGWNQV